jgi:serine/threonine protein kinase
MARSVSPQANSQRSAFRKEPGLEPIPGYRLIEPLGSGGFGEVWKCEAPGGLLKAIKFVYGSRSALDEGSAPAENEMNAIQQVKAIRHPFLLSMERVERIGGELVIVLELADKSLNDLLAEYRRAGREGIPRKELFGYLRETAEALDLMNLQHNLQHLDIKPRNLFLVGNHVKVGDFGLVNRLGWGDGNRPATPHLDAITPLYASPEVFQGTISRSSDQYSLAIVYMELLTGRLPFDGQNSRQLLLQHLQAEPDLGPLPEADRPAVARALAKNPDRRFPSCADFIFALICGAGTGERPAGGGKEGRRAKAARKKRSERAEIGADTATIGPANTQAHEPDPAGTARAGGPRAAATLAGHRLLECVLRTPFTEVWKAQAPDGTNRLVKSLFGLGGRESGADGDAVRRLLSLRHPALLPVEVLQRSPGCLVLASGVAEKTLRDRFQECLAQGLPGIPRPELLGYVGCAAEALQHLAWQHGVQHLGLNPGNLLLDQGRLLIADFGLVQLLWLPAGQEAARLNGRYAAPELKWNQVHPSSDQYSLALIYHEMLTGTHAPSGQAGQKTVGGQCALDRLPASDRAVISRALDSDPGRRWPSCAVMVQAMGYDGKGEQRAANGEPRESRASPDGQDPDRGNRGTGSAPVLDLRPTAGPVGDSLHTRFASGLAPSVIRLRLDAFRQQWNGQLLKADDQNFAFQMKAPSSFWQRWLGRQPALEVHIRLTRAAGAPAEGTEVAVGIRPRGWGPGGEHLAIIGPLLLESMRTFLQVAPLRRAQERFPWHHPLRVCPVNPDGTVGEVVEGRGSDISLNGIGFVVPRQLPTSQVLLHLPRTPQTPEMTIQARIVRVRACADGWYEVGCILLPPADAQQKINPAAKEE